MFLSGLRKGLFFLFFADNLQEEEIKDRAGKIEHAEQRLTNLSLELKVSFRGF